MPMPRKLCDGPERRAPKKGAQMYTSNYDYILIKLTAAEKKKFGKFCANQAHLPGNKGPSDAMSIHLKKYITGCIKSTDTNRMFFPDP
jgi:hypothetical protein